jgi:ATP adenylyltransferase
MERVFAPWRNAYVASGEKPTGCVMCHALEHQDTLDSLVVHVGARCFVMMNLFPYGSGHVMVVPKRHVGSLGEAGADELAELMTLGQRLERVFAEVYRPDGLNLGMNLGRAAGAGVADHIHLHVLPRWNGDTNFMTTVGETRVVPEDPRRACERLRECFR